MSVSLHADAYCQVWQEADENAWRIAPPAPVVVMLAAAGFAAAVNQHLRSMLPSDVVVLSDGFGGLSKLDYDRLIVTAWERQCLVRATHPEAVLLAAPGAALAEAGLNANLRYFYWGDELEDRMGSVALDVEWVDYNGTGRQDAMGLHYYDAIADMAVLEART